MPMVTGPLVSNVDNDADVDLDDAVLLREHLVNGAAIP